MHLCVYVCVHVCCVCYAILYCIILNLQVMATADEAAFQNCLSRDNDSFIFNCGFACTLHMSNREEVLGAVWLHLTYFSIQAELSQLRAGLTEVLNFSQRDKNGCQSQMF